MPIPALRIAQVAPPFEAVPPDRLRRHRADRRDARHRARRRGHDVTLFASGDSTAPGPARAGRAAGAPGAGPARPSPRPYLLATQLAVLREAVVVRRRPRPPRVRRPRPRPCARDPDGRDVPRPDRPAVGGRPPGRRADGPGRDQRRPGLRPPRRPLVDRPQRARARTAPPSTSGAATGCATSGGSCRRRDSSRPSRSPAAPAGRSGWRPRSRRRRPSRTTTTSRSARPAASGRRRVPRRAGRAGPRRLIAGSYATLMPGAWPEPFGLVAIESLACGTPVVARRTGALPGDRPRRDRRDRRRRRGRDGSRRLPEVAGVDRAAIRASVLARFSAERMVDGYEALYARLGRRSPSRAAPPILSEPVAREARAKAPGDPAHAVGPPTGR